MVVPWNAPIPMLVTLDGMKMEVNATHPSNALSEISATVDGMKMEVNATHPTNASTPMLVTLVPSSICSISLKSLLPFLTTII